MNHLLTQFREFSRTSNWSSQPQTMCNLTSPGPPRPASSSSGSRPDCSSAIIADLSRQTFTQVKFHGHLACGGGRCSPRGWIPVFALQSRWRTVCGVLWLSGLLMSVDGVGRGGGGVMLWAGVCCGQWTQVRFIGTHRDLVGRSWGPSWCHSSTISMWLICSIIHFAFTSTNNNHVNRKSLHVGVQRTNSCPPPVN